MSREEEDGDAGEGDDEGVGAGVLLSTHQGPCLWLLQGPRSVRCMTILQLFKKFELKIDAVKNKSCKTYALSFITIHSFSVPKSLYGSDLAKMRYYAGKFSDKMCVLGVY